MISSESDKDVKKNLRAYTTIFTSQTHDENSKKKSTE